MDFNTRKKIQHIVDEATNTTETAASKDHLQQLKSQISKNKENVVAAFELILQKLKAETSQVRILSWSLIVYLFSRSKIARELIEMNIQDLMKFTLGYGGERYKLPPPFDVARQLQQQSLQNLREWSQAHPNLLRLATTERFLTNQVLPTLHVVDLRKERPKPKQNLATIEQNVKNSRFENLLNTLDDKITDIQHAFDQMVACFSLLFPEFQVPETYVGEGTLEEEGASEVVALQATEDEVMGGVEDRVSGDGPEIEGLSDVVEQEGEGDGSSVSLISVETLTEFAWEDGDQDMGNGVTWEEGDVAEQEEVAPVDDEEDIDDIIGFGGLGTTEYELLITIDKTQPTDPESLINEENKDLFDNLYSMHRALEIHHLPFVRNSIVTLTEATEPKLEIEKWKIVLEEIEKKMEDMNSSCWLLGLAKTKIPKRRQKVVKPVETKQKEAPPIPEGTPSTPATPNQQNRGKRGAGTPNKAKSPTATPNNKTKRTNFIEEKHKKARKTKESESPAVGSRNKSLKLYSKKSEMYQFR